MTGRQERFVREYLVDLCAARAARRAGYSVKNARSIGCRLLKREDVQREVAKAMDAEKQDAALRRDGALSVRFRLSQQWRTSFLAVAPAGWCIVYRRDIAGTGTFHAFEKALRDSMLYADRKRKKTIAMAVTSGLFSSEETADHLIDHMSFSYLEGEDMHAAVAAWERL